MWEGQVWRGEVEEQEVIYRSVSSPGPWKNLKSMLLHTSLSCSGYITRLKELNKCIFIEKLANGGKENWSP